ncbi:plasmid replication initiator protein [Actinoplanes sp. TRM 88003]|uniref:Plasmid replication initiator protein n=1 Tax=Paractinoplanes aksuensis TaxID=2939490 RepID=A0ABT1DL10_9ACTN|nr:replication initiator [Actinoplanes aksuensis]MCO8271524.1 plasmid replication initiator protein [Actinoplanes aksuensis]
MTSSTLDLAPREHSARGAGSNAATGWTPPAAHSTAAGQALTRASRPDYFDWLSHVQAASGCTRPIRLSGTLDSIEAATGRLLDSRHTDQLPDAAIYKACGTRLASVCPSCARTYQRDAYQILRSFLVGGKGIPATVAKHPAVFPTFTAPSFGIVHTRVVRKHTCTNRKRCTCQAEPCHARRDTPAPCEHGHPVVCWRRHTTDDPALGQPLCLDCYDYDHHVVWNLFSTELWHRTKQAADRYLAQLCKARGLPPVAKTTPSGKVRMVPAAQLTHGKAAEMQRRAVVHFHALVRLDGVHPDDPDAVLIPPPGVDVDDIIAAFHHAVRTISFTTPAHPDNREGWDVRWGDPDKGFDIQALTLAGDGSITDDMVGEQLASQKAGYLAKYTTKSTEATGFSSTRITDDTIGQYDPDGDHIARLVAACWRIGRPISDLSARTRPPGDRPRTATGGPFGEPWDCPDCGTHTRYRACPVCVAERQANLDTKPTSGRPATNPYARLRRWAHRFGFAGHFLTKTRRRVVRFATLRDTRIVYRRTEDQAATDPSTVRAVDHLDETTLIVGNLSFAGVGWHNNGDALLANTAAAMARARHETGREELAHEAGFVVPLALQAA